MNKGYFKTQSLKYLPKKIKYLLIAESPANDIRNFFFFDGENPKNQMFFQNIIKAIYDEHYKNEQANKKYFLNKFKEDGFYLIDAVEYPITVYTDSERRRLILEGFPELIKRLTELNNKNLMDDRTKIILIKKLVCELLKERIENNKDFIFDKSNGIGIVGFPRFYSDPLFINTIKALIKNDTL